MKRLAFRMQLKKGQKDVYIQRHNAIWSELEQLLKESGISEYSIFLEEETNTLFAFQKVDGNVSSQELSQHPIINKWWDYMADIMEVNPDKSPVSKPLEEVFYLKGDKNDIY
ncbi:L-rhamnose mutarotase [Formosa sp. PL04]|uniref:L-rhamnose mutarotase n=1 Tax=Formosa sp. PL04 TaxID=3081755 RepID=UPI0029825553|nr:L-rhamnose mutarotase [Formosa sp. PL04]MDW5288111.1 L-rhamnose mutarotase [Formosa sp. PL04]